MTLFMKFIGRNSLLILLMGLGAFLMLCGPWLISVTPLGAFYDYYFAGGRYYDPVFRHDQYTFYPGWTAQSFFFLFAGIAVLRVVTFFTGLHWFLRRNRINRAALCIALGIICVWAATISICAVHVYQAGIKFIESHQMI